MRPLLLRLKNIASLRGEHTINFREIQSHSPLFAITGETGAGKSSILNAIALGLYGEVYKKNVNQVDVVTLGEKEARIEFIFQIKGQTYLADWIAKVRKQNGELLKQPQIQRYIYPLSGEDFDSPKEHPVESVEILLNLDFDQFCKCVILNQGEFARFLSSSFTERKEILEKFYPGETLEKLGRELRNQMEVIQKNKNNLEVELTSLKGDGINGAELVSQKELIQTELGLQERWLNKLDTLDSHFGSMFSYHEKYFDNHRRSQQISNILTEATAAFDSVRMLEQAISSQREDLKKFQEKELPRLQKLLQSEESLRHQEASRSEHRQRGRQIDQQLATTTSKLNEIMKREKDWQAEQGPLMREFTFPLADLKRHRQSLDLLIDLFAEKEQLENELKLSQEKLSTIETQGKDLNTELSAALEKLKLLPPDPADALLKLEERKQHLSLLHERRQKLNFQQQELNLQHQELSGQKEKLEQKKILLLSQVEALQQEISPLEITLKLQELIAASWTCLQHVKSSNTSECPVCHTHSSTERWQELAGQMEQTDVAPLKQKRDTLTRSLMKAEEEIKLHQHELKAAAESMIQKEISLKTILLDLQIPLTPLKELEDDIQRTRKECWEWEELQKEVARLKLELQKARENYSRLKGESLLKAETLADKSNQLSKLVFSLQHFLPGEINQQLIAGLKDECRRLGRYQEHETLGEKIQQEKLHLLENKSSLELAENQLKTQIAELSQKISEVKAILDQELAGKEAAVLIAEMSARVKVLDEEWNKLETQLRKKELEVKELQARLHTLEDLQKDIELQYQHEMKFLKQHDLTDLSPINQAQKLLTEKFSSFDLAISGPAELFIPLKELLTQERSELRNKTNEGRMGLAALGARLAEWEKRQQRITLLQLSHQELHGQFNRLTQLFEVLGKDELRTFVLSLVEENLIQYTNEELQRLCQGRYEIVHQTRGQRMSPEFYILDKFREGGQRKVSTLSGGETFMVSLAMALALAEMTRGQAEVDSLFIDEGFGTLDQESLEDVLDMLHQIQNRGLMVGIISHIKPLTSALTVNLVLTKKNDGTSDVQIRLN